MRKGTFCGFIALGLYACSGVLCQSKPESRDDRIQSALTSLPGYGVYDFLTFRTAAGGKVVLLGAVTDAGLKDQAEKAVKALDGVTGVEDDIEVLPKSAEDDSVRKAVYNAVYGGPAPSIYAAKKTIHIIVKNREVTLEGTVNSDVDRTMIASAAAGAGDMYSFTDHLKAPTEDSADAQWRRDLDGATVPGPDPGE